MCRIAAYQGPSIPLENIVIRPRHSLLSQSLAAREAKTVVNGDGFGLCWYGEDPEPGLYKEVRPAWGDENLRDLCRLVRAPLFMAHVRAATVGGTSRENCHPFVRGHWSFCHNGQVPHMDALRRGLEAALPDPLFAARRGTTDSELVFLTLIALGLPDDPAGAVSRLLDRLYPVTTDAPLRLTCVFSDGAALYGLRHASDGLCPTLYWSPRLDTGGSALASEPLCETPGRWQEVPQDSLIRLRDGHVDVLWSGQRRVA